MNTAISLYYPIVFALSVLLTGCYALLWKKHDDIHITLVFVLIPISNLGNLLLSMAESREAALIANKIYYVGGSYLQLVLLLAIFSLCRIHLNRWLKLLFMLISTLVFLSALTIGKKDWYYKNAYLEQNGSSYVLVKEYGVMHSVFYILVCVFHHEPGCYHLCLPSKKSDQP